MLELWWMTIALPSLSSASLRAVWHSTLTRSCYLIKRTVSDVREVRASVWTQDHLEISTKRKRTLRNKQKSAFKGKRPNWKHKPGRWPPLCAEHSFPISSSQRVITVYFRALCSSVGVLRRCMSSYLLAKIADSVWILAARTWWKTECAPIKWCRFSGLWFGFPVSSDGVSVGNTLKSRINFWRIFHLFLWY